MNKKILLCIALLPMTLFADEQAISQQPKEEVMFPHAAKLRQTFAIAEQQVEKLEQDNEKLLKTWYQSVAALSLALKSLAKFDCNVIQFEIGYIQKYIKRNEQLSNSLIRSVNCEGEGESKCLQEVQEVEQQIEELQKLVGHQKQMIAKLDQQNSKCKNRGEINE